MIAWLLIVLPVIVVLIGFFAGTPDRGVVIYTNEPPRRAVRKGLRLLDNRQRLAQLVEQNGHYLWQLPIDGVGWLHYRATGRQAVRATKRRLALVVVLVFVVGVSII